MNAQKGEFGQYYPGQRNRVNYATYVIGLACEQEMSIEENELVKKVAEHFERKIRRTVTGYKIQTVNEFL